MTVFLKNSSENNMYWDNLTLALVFNMCDLKFIKCNFTNLSYLDRYTSPRVSCPGRKLLLE